MGGTDVIDLCIILALMPFAMLEILKKKNPVN